VTECQLTWAIQKQKQAMRFCVGDPCQSIYGFRGAILESEFETVLRDELTSKPMLLSQSFRFGCDIARVANAMLFIRFNLKETPKNSVRFRYHVHGKSPSPCVAVHSCSPEAAHLLCSAHTLIARTNLQLVKEVLELWEKDPTIKIHVNGATTRRKFQDCLQAIEAAFPLFTGCAGAKYNKFLSWSALKRHAELQSEDGDDEMSVLVMMVHIIEMYRDQTLIKCDNFRRAIRANYRANEADVIVTTTHQAKGLEFDTVRLCDDFADLCVFEKNELKFRVNASDANLWYVAVTRACRVVVLPPKFMELSCRILETLDECSSNTGVDGTNFHAMSSRARAKLFYNWPLPLLAHPADVPSSPARVRSVTP
jgi:superfamily I DNA/RNA helicase